MLLYITLLNTKGKLYTSIRRGSIVYYCSIYNDDTGVMTVYYNEGKKKSPDPFTYSFDKNTMRLVIVFDSDPEPPIVYDVKVSEGWLKLDCISGDFEDFSMYKIK